MDRRQWRHLGRLLLKPDFLTPAQLDAALLESCGPDGCLSGQLLQTLLQNGASLECQDENGRTPLVRCVLYNRVPAAECLLREGAKNGGSFTAVTPLSDMYRFVWSTAFSVGLGQSCLSFSVEAENHSMMRLLTRHGAAVTMDEAMWAITTGTSVETLHILMDGGTDFRRMRGRAFGVGGPTWSVLDCAFAFAAWLELFNSAGGSRGKWQNVNKMVAFLLRSHCPRLCASVVRSAVGRGAFLTVCETLKRSLEIGRKFVWPLELCELPALSGASRAPRTNAAILREMVRRSRGQCKNAAVVISYLDGIRQRTPDFAPEVNLLRNFCIDAVRSAISEHGRNPQTAVEKLPLPRNVMQQLCLDDLERLLDKASAVLWS